MFKFLSFAALSLSAIAACGQVVCNNNQTPVYVNNVIVDCRNAPVPNSPSNGAATTDASKLTTGIISAARLPSQLNDVTTTKINNTILTSGMQTNSTSGDGLSKIEQSSSACATGIGPVACDILTDPGYLSDEFSYMLDPTVSGGQDQYNYVPFLGGFRKIRFHEDHRRGNRWWTSVNPISVNNQIIDYSTRVPFIMQNIISSDVGYAQSTGVLALRLRETSGSNNTGAAGATKKGNWGVLTLDAKLKHPGQGGGNINDFSIHTAPGDDMDHAIQHTTNGCSEGEDECDKLFRAFFEDMTQRAGGKLHATPAIDSANFGNYVLRLDTYPGIAYDPDFTGEGVFAVNLSQAITSGNVVAIQNYAIGIKKIILDTTAQNTVKTHGTGILTTLTGPIEPFAHSTGCPNISLGGSEPTTDPMIIDENGIGGFTNYCLPVASTVGMASSGIATIAGPKATIEQVKYTVVDSTHVTVNTQLYHDTGEYFAAQGMQGWGLSMTADNIAPYTIMNNTVQPATNLYKFYPIMTSDSSGNLYLYVNGSIADEINTKAYISTAPAQAATLGTPVLSGTSLASISVTNAANYQVSGTNLAGTGQTVLSPPTLTVDPTHVACTTQPQVTTTYSYASFRYIPTFTVTNAGVCQSVPSVVLQSSWTNPFQMAPLAITKKVVDPTNGKSNTGYIMTGALNPSLWNANDHINIPGWIHSYMGADVSFSKYMTAASGQFGIHYNHNYNGTWGGADTLEGTNNTTDGHAYYSDATNPVGPGIAYMSPPSGHAMTGDYSVVYPIYNPPSDTVLDIGCKDKGGVFVYHPCRDSIATAFNFFRVSMQGANAFSHWLRFDPTVKDSLGNVIYRLTWTGHFTANAGIDASVIAATTSMTSPLVVAMKTDAQYQIVAKFGGFYGAYAAFYNCDAYETNIDNCHIAAKQGWLYDSGRSYQVAFDSTMYDQYGALVSMGRHWDDGMWDVDGITACAAGERICNVADSWAFDSSGNLRVASVQLTSQPSITCNSANRGRQNYVAGAASAKDVFEVCAKDATDTYAWRVLY